MFNVSFQAKGFAPTKPIKLPKDVIGWPQPKETPPFAKGGPKKVEIPNDIDEFTNNLWSALNEDNKVSLFVRFIDLETGNTKTKIVNKNK